ncbi:MAG: hypothetical protein H7301_03445 [Cryobacterium sp.]|nr:hypothetical protein [Oligoflexia bacterium]
MLIGLSIAPSPAIANEETSIHSTSEHPPLLLVERYFSVYARPDVPKIGVRIGIRTPDNGEIVEHFLPFESGQRGLLLVKLTRHPTIPPTYTVKSEKSGKTGKLYHEMVNRLRLTYSIYSDRGTVPTAAIETMVSRDLELDPLRLNVVTFSDEEGPRFVVRTVDGSPRVSMAAAGSVSTVIEQHGGYQKIHANPFLKASVSPPVPIPLNLDYPELVLPPSEDRIEIGRAAKYPGILDDISSLFSQTSSIIEASQSRFDLDGHYEIPESSGVYAEATGVMAGYYVKNNGFKIKAGNLSQVELERLRPDLLTYLEPDYQWVGKGDFERTSYLKGVSEHQRFILRAPTRDFVALHALSFQGATLKNCVRLLKTPVFIEKIILTFY